MSKFMTKQSSLGILSFLLILLILVEVPNTVVYAEEIREQAVDVEALFKKAMKERKEGNYKASIITFQSILNSQPMLHRARLEMAVAYYKSMQYREALQEAEIVLDAPDTPPDVRVAVLTFISQVNSRADKVGAK